MINGIIRLILLIIFAAINCYFKLVVKKLLTNSYCKWIQ